MEGGCGFGDKCVKNLQLLSFNVVDNSHHRSLDHRFGRLKEELDNAASATGDTSFLFCLKNL